jgi:transposase-like protein
VSTTKRLKKRYQRHPKKLRAMAMERLKNCPNVTALALELGIDRMLLYKWRERMESREGKEGLNDLSQRARSQEIDELKRLLAEKTLEVDFFKGALQKIAARRRNKNESGEKASTTKSGR